MDNKKTVVIIKNTDNEPINSIILEQLSTLVSKRSDVLETSLVKNTIEEYKGEENVALEIVFNIGASIAGSMIYEWLKKIYKSIGTKKKSKLKVSIDDVESEIELAHPDKKSSSPDDI